MNTLTTIALIVAVALSTYTVVIWLALLISAAATKRFITSIGWGWAAASLAAWVAWAVVR